MEINKLGNPNDEERPCICNIFSPCGGEKDREVGREGNCDENDVSDS